jgi:hypothetical protein
MRLEILRSGHRRVQKFFLGIIRRLVGQVPGPIATMSYRSEFWGKEFSGCLQEAMRGPSSWSVGEREIFSAFVSNLNQCRY